MNVSESEVRTDAHLNYEDPLLASIRNMTSEEMCIRLLDGLCRAAEASDGTPVSERVVEGHFLAVKFFQHASSIVYLTRSTQVPDMPSVGVGFWDFPSVNVLVRSATESFLTFHHIFVDPKTPELHDFRYYAWKHAGLCEIERFPPLSSNTSTRQAETQPHRVGTRKELESNAVFIALDKRARKRVLRGDWKTRSWRDIAKDAGLAEVFANTIYAYLCGYAHSGWLSIDQLRATKGGIKQREMFAGTFGYLRIVTAYVIDAYCRLFPNTREVVENDLLLSILVEINLDIGHTEASPHMLDNSSPQQISH